jgi:hypothetical protein
MDTKDLLEKTYDLFLTTEVLIEDSPMANRIKDLIENRQYEKAIRLLIYTLMFEINNYSIYNKIRQKELNDCIIILHTIDETGLTDSNIIEFIKTISRFCLYSSENKLNLRTNKEKSESIKAKLAELAILIKE